ncbi:N-acetyl-alpha-D-glucosaminyl L-malate synthase BshA [bacterium]|nr:N-acetyl-alpha-D-glucosaminyl L-malate synthase BshA [bacterium]
MNPAEKRRLKIGIVCYPTTGGSGIVAVELAHALADRGHEVHVISYAVPVRLDTLRPNLRFHMVHVPDYPLFEYPPYSLALAAQIAEVSCKYDLDVMHVHYAIPHAISGWLARRICGRSNMPLITTLHGTDITIIGKDKSYLPITRFSLEESDLVTVVSSWLGEKVREVVKCSCPYEVVYNFVDPEVFKPRKNGEPRPFPTDPDVPVLMHMSNFRPVKRVQDVVDTFLGLRERMRAQLVMIGDGPDAAAAKNQLYASPYADDVHFLGPQQNAEKLLPFADAFLFPSNAESFGLAALEAQACGVPVIGYTAGGLPEVIEHDKTGFLCEVGSVDKMIDACEKLFRSPELQQAMAQAARERASTQFLLKPAVDRYQELYWQAMVKLESQSGAV